MLRLGPLPSLCAVVLVALVLGGAGAASAQTVGPVLDISNPAGTNRLMSTAGPVSVTHPFAQSLGSNGRSCVTCHSPMDGMSVTPASLRARFDASNGFDPIFRPNDGTNSPLADVSTLEARRNAYSMLLSRGVIRVELLVPPGAEFVVDAVDDPYGFADRTRLSLFRRPLPSINTTFLTSLMWDGRETFGDMGLAFSLGHQANSATLGHAQASSGLTSGQSSSIVGLETTIFAAQIADAAAGPLAGGGVSGGPEALAGQEFFPGINTGPGATPVVFNLFNAWVGLQPTNSAEAARRSIANGQSLFNTLRFGAGGLTCTSCHNAPNVGSSSVGMFFDTGISGGAVRPRDPALPLYTVRCVTTGQTFRTTDPGRAMVTGRCADLNRFKVPTLRGLAARAPFFHDGSAASLRAVVLFYNDVFNMGLRTFEVDDLAAFLGAL